MKNRTVELYFKKVKPIQDLIEYLIRTNPDLSDDVASIAIDDLKIKYDYPEFEMNAIRFIETMDSFSEEEWELFVDKNLSHHFSFN